jgi:hypothetical protein
VGKAVGLLIGATPQMGHPLWVRLASLFVLPFSFSCSSSSSKYSSPNLVLGMAVSLTCLSFSYTTPWMWGSRIFGGSSVNALPSLSPPEPEAPGLLLRALSGEYHHSRNLKKKMEAGSAYLSASKKMNGDDRSMPREKASGRARGDGRLGGTSGGDGG